MPQISNQQTDASSPEEQRLLLCLFPFAGVVDETPFSRYVTCLQKQKALHDWPLERLPEMLQLAQDWSLLAPHQIGGFLQLQPGLTSFLKTQLEKENQPDAVREAIEDAFVQYYRGIGNNLDALLRSKEPREQARGPLLAYLEYENLSHAMSLALDRHESIDGFYWPLSAYLDSTNDQQRGLELGQRVYERLQAYPSELLKGALGLEMVKVLDDVAKRYFLHQAYDQAKTFYQEVLQRFEALVQAGVVDPGPKASMLHQLGYIAQEEKEWEEAKGYYQQALHIFQSYNDWLSQAKTHHQLGRVAEEQKEWEEARGYYQRALQIKKKYNDRPEQALLYHNLGRVAQEQKEWEEAKGYYQQSLHIFQEYNDRNSQAKTFHNLGTVTRELKEWEDAQRYYQQALQIFLEYKDQHHLAMLLRNCIRLWQAHPEESLLTILADSFEITVDEVKALFDKLSGAASGAGE